MLGKPFENRSQGFITACTNRNPYWEATQFCAVWQLTRKSLLEDTVCGVKGEEPRGSGFAEWLAQLQESSTQIQKEGIRGIHLEEDFGHLIGPDLGAACICMQTVSKPEQDTMLGFWRELEQILQHLVDLFMELSHELFSQKTQPQNIPISQSWYFLF